MKLASWRTSLTGLGAIATVIGGAIKALTDGDPTTVVDLEKVILGVVAGIGLMVARDNVVTSEASGAKLKEREDATEAAHKKLPMLFLIPFLFLFLFSGCRGIGPNGPNTATGGLDPATLFKLAGTIGGKEAKNRYGVDPVEMLGLFGTQAADHDCISWPEVGSAFAIYEAGKSNAPMRDLFQLLYLQKHPPAPVVTPPVFGSP